MKKIYMCILRIKGDMTKVIEDSGTACTKTIERIYNTKHSKVACGTK